MGYYINSLPDGSSLEAQHKANDLIDSGATELSGPPASLANVPQDKALLCVVSNPMFDAAALAYSDPELEEFKQPDGRPKRWLLMNKQTAHRLAGYTSK